MCSIQYSIMRLFSIFSVCLLLFFTGCARYSASDEVNEPSGTELSQQLLSEQKAGRSGKAAYESLAELDPKKLVAELNNKNKKLAFWINIYNGMVHYLLTEQPDLWESRNTFFSEKRFTVAGELLSLENVEHGIIRGGEAKLGLGFIPQLFPGKFKRSFKIKGGDPRIHFALNCGAIDCPPVEIYEPATVDARLDYRSKTYLTRVTEVDDTEEVIRTTPLFSWFRGDFRAYDGIDDFLVHFGIITEEQKSYSKDFKDYDWTLEMDVWAED